VNLTISTRVPLRKPSGLGVLSLEPIALKD
jgi:hypothetical protein